MKITARRMLLVAGVAAAMVLGTHSTPGVADPAAPAGLYTAEQALAGKAYAEVSCSLCHLATLKGRVGDASESPKVDSLKPKFREFVESAAEQVPPLVGDEFLAKYSDKTLGKFALEQVLGAMHAFGPPGVDTKKDKTVYLQITAYILQMNGLPAGKQPLTVDDATPMSRVARH